MQRASVEQWDFELLLKVCTLFSDEFVTESPPNLLMDKPLRQFVKTTFFRIVALGFFGVHCIHQANIACMILMMGRRTKTTTTTTTTSLPPPQPPLPRNDDNDYATSVHQWRSSRNVFLMKARHQPRSSPSPTGQTSRQRNTTSGHLGTFIFIFISKTPTWGGWEGEREKQREKGGGLLRGYHNTSRSGKQLLTPFFFFFYRRSGVGP